MRMFNRYYSRYDLLLLAGDMILAALGTEAARFGVVLGGFPESPNWTLWTVQSGIVTVAIVVSFYCADLYAIDQTLSARELFLRLTNGFGLTCLIVAAVTYLFPALEFRKMHLPELIPVVVGLFCWRLWFIRVLKKVGVRNKVLIVGTQSIGRLVAEELLRQKHLGLEVFGFIGERAGHVVLSYGNPKRISIPVFPKQDIMALVGEEGVNRILVAGAESIANFPALEPVLLRLKGIPIEDCHTFYERLMSKIAVTDLQPGWIALASGFRRTRWVLLTKRAIDMFVSALGLVLAAPIAALAAVAIKIESGGPILYRQERVGQDEHRFTLYKFRSMVADAEAETGPVWAAVDDPRVTRVGKIIRKLRIDEIPQMINVLTGEMSFVGPRPERPFFVSQLKQKIPYYGLRFSVKPGITGWAQILHDYGDSEEDALEKLQYELYYIKNVSVVFDLQIILETFKVIIFGRGAR